MNCEYYLTINVPTLVLTYCQRFPTSATSIYFFYLYTCITHLSVNSILWYIDLLRFFSASFTSVFFSLCHMCAHYCIDVPTDWCALVCLFCCVCCTQTAAGCLSFPGMPDEQRDKKHWCHTSTQEHQTFFSSSKERESVEPGLDTGRCEREKDERDQMENKEIGSWKDESRRELSRIVPSWMTCWKIVSKLRTDTKLWWW